MTELLRLEGIGRSYGALKAVDGVDLVVPQGEALGIIGPNGAGKTTLFNLITGDTPASGGRCHFEGRDITRLALWQRCRAGICRSHQIPHPFGNMTVFGNLMVGAIHGAGLSQRAGAERAAEVLELTGLAPHANDPAARLTLLSRKRLELARAMTVNPRLLLLDEIAGGLTEPECAELIETIRKVHAGGTTIIWIEHVLHALLSVVSRLMVMNFGRKLTEGAPEAVMADPAVREIYMGMAE
jgi:branched-chain amino acid transport system ATP-binding protein